MSEDSGGVRHRIAIVTDDAPLAQLIAELLATRMPSVTTEVVPLATASRSETDALIVDAAARGSKEVSAVQELRAGGYSGSIVLLASACDAATDHRLLALAPARCVARGSMLEGIPAALAELSTQPALDAELGPLQQELRRIQQVIAMGEATSRIQHTLNNPLTALLAEAQLLEMEELSDDHRAAVKRIIELCRRLVGMVRGLHSGTR